MFPFKMTAPKSKFSLNYTTGEIQRRDVIVKSNYVPNQITYKY